MTKYHVYILYIINSKFVNSIIRKEAGFIFFVIRNQQGYWYKFNLKIKYITYDLNNIGSYMVVTQNYIIVKNVIVKS